MSMQSLFVIIKYNRRCTHAEYFKHPFAPFAVAIVRCQFIFRYALLEEKYIYFLFKH